MTFSVTVKSGLIEHLCEYLESGRVKLILYGQTKFQGDSVPLTTLSKTYFEKNF